jgi:outer membrane protein TolC
MQKRTKKLLMLVLLSFSGYAAMAQTKNLDYYLNQGLQGSPLLKDYQYQIQAFNIDSQLLRATYRPQVSAVSSTLIAPVVKGWGYDAAITNQYNFAATAGVSQTLVSKNNTNNQYLAIRLQSMGLQNQGKITEQDLRKSITQQYITAYGDMQQVDFNNELLGLLKQEQDILKKLAERGVYKQTDFLSFLVTVQQQELAIRQLRIQYQNDFAVLNYLSGLVDTSNSNLPYPVLLPKILPGVEQTVFYQQYQIDSLKIKTADKQVDYNYQPKLSVFGDGGYNSSFAITPYKNFGVSGGINFTVPIYDGRQRKMQHQKNKIAELSRVTYRDYFTNQYQQQIIQLTQQLNSLEQLNQDTKKQVDYAGTLIKAQRQQLVTGDLRIADYIITIGNYLNAKNLFTQNAINKLQIINQINYWDRTQ